MHTSTPYRLKISLTALGILSTFGVSGCGGGGSSHSSNNTPAITGPQASLIGSNDPSGMPLGGGQGPSIFGVLEQPGDPTVLANYSPVGVHLTWKSAGIPLSEILEYHVYRPDFAPLNIQTATDGLKSMLCPVLTQTSTDSLDTWDDGSDHSLSFNTLDRATGTSLNVTSGGGFVSGIGIKASLVGKRWQYMVEVLYRDSHGDHLSPKVATNFVTYLQPPILTPGSFSGVSPSRVFLSLAATLSADDYVLELSSSPTFAVKKTYTPYDPALIQYTAAHQTNPRTGPVFAFFDPAKGLDMSQAFPSTYIVYARVGVRDSRNGADATVNPYLYSQTVQVPSALV